MRTLADVPVNNTSVFTVCYRVATVNSIGRSESSQPVEVHPESIIPGPPEELKADTTNSNSITISWKNTRVNPQASKGYQICHKKIHEEAWMLKSADADTFSCTVFELRPNTEYMFIVQALNGTLISEATTLLVRTPPSVPPKPRPPIVIPKGKDFTLKAYLPPVEESGKEVTHLHVNYYSYDIDLKLTQNYKIEQKENITHEQQIQVNIDETFWISICLSNEVGKSQESDLAGISHNGVTPGEPDELECTAEARSVELSWKTPKMNGSVAKYYEILIEDTEDREWKILYVSVHQTRFNETFSYQATVKDLTPFTTYHFGVQAVNSTTTNVCVGDIAKLVAKTKKAPPDKHIKSVAVESTVGEPAITIATKPIQATPKIYSSAPSSLVVAKTGSNSVKIRWKKPKKNPEQVHFYTVKLRAGNYIKTFEERRKILKVNQVRRTLGNSTVFENLDPFTTYTVSVGCYNDNKKRHEDAITYEMFTTRKIADARLAAHILSAPTQYDPVAVAYVQEADEDMDQSDDEFKADPRIYPSVPEELTWELYERNKLKVDWKLPKHNSEEVHHFEVQISEEGSEKILHGVESYETSETFMLADVTKRYKVSVTSFNFYGNKRHDATNTLVIP